jgi:putative ABC transport system permease protein
VVDNVRLPKLYPAAFEGKHNAAELKRLGKEFYRRFIDRQLEMNDHRAIIVGVCEATRTFQSNPVIYTTYSRAKSFAPQERKILSYVLARTEPGLEPKAVAANIKAATGLGAVTSEEFTWMTIEYYLKYTGIPINFGITTVLGFLVGTAIAGQTFYNFTLENLRQFGALKAMGATNLRIVGMILLQALVVGMLGYGLGVGLATLFGWMNQSPSSNLWFFATRPVLAVIGGIASLLVLGACVRMLSWDLARRGLVTILVGFGAAFAAAWLLSGLHRDEELAFFTPWPILLVSAGAIILICILSSLLSVRRVIVLEPAVVFRS